MARLVGTRPTQVTVGVLNHKFKRHPQGTRTEITKLALRITADPQEHEVYDVRHVEMVLRICKRIRSADETFRLRPEVSRAIVDLLVVHEIVVGVDRLVVCLRAAIVTLRHVGAPTLAQVILPPVVAV